MTQQNINTMQDILDAPEQNPELQHEFHKHLVDVIRNDDALRQDMRKEILTEELMQLPTHFAEFVHIVTQLSANFEDLVEVTNRRLTNLEGDAAELKAGQQRLERDVGSLRDDVGVLKRDAALRATRVVTYDIAYDMGHQIIRDLPRAEVRAMSRERFLPDMPRNSRRSFAVADAIIEVTTQENAIGYIAVEVSYTADERDTFRAIRNAHYIRRMTGQPAWAAVSALRVDDRIQHLIDCGAVHWHQLEPEDFATD